MKKEGFYVLEGLDGVGKSTIKEMLKEEGYVVFRTPPDTFPIKRELYDNFLPHQRFLMYLAGVFWADKEIASARLDQTIFCDRFVLTTLSAAEAGGVDPIYLSSLQDVLEALQRPSATFLLVADEEERIRRMMSRGANQNDIDNLKINNQILEGYRKWSKKLSHNLIEVDTTNMPPQEVVNFIISHVKNET